jgi:hypothetical protein
VDEPKREARETFHDGGAMFHPVSYQLYRYEYGLSAAEQRTADVRAGEAAAALRDLRLRLGRAFGLRHRVRPVRATAGAVTGSVAAAPTRVPSRIR